MKIYKIKVNGKSYKVELEAMEEVASEKVTVEKKAEAPKAVPTGAGNQVVSPIQGTVLNLKVKVGDKIKKGQCVAIVEAMKLENEVVSEFDGKVSEILVSKGQNVTAESALMIVE